MIPTMENLEVTKRFYDELTAIQVCLWLTGYVSRTWKLLDIATILFYEIERQGDVVFQENQFFLSVHVRCLLLAESIDLLVERNGVTGNF